MTTQAPPGAGAQGRARCMGVVIDNSLFGIPLEHVQGVIAEGALSRVFHAPPLLAGVMSLRGEVLPVLDPALLLGERSRPVTAQSRIVVVRERGGLGRKAGLRIAELAGLRDVPENGLEPVPSLLPGRIGSLLLGVLPEPPICAVLDIQALFDVPELSALRGEASAPAP